ncbi:MAG TPA: hypothetical protein VME69_13205, partial [Methylocella sp.]|nr:hypothetical protein [Methylocella sp.]
DAEWRWLLDRVDSPWYPSMRLFRQEQRGMWEDVVARITTAVAPLASLKTTPCSIDIPSAFRIDQ